MCELVSHVPIIINKTYKPAYITYFDWRKISLISPTLDDRVINPLLLIHNPRYSIYVHPNNNHMHLILIHILQVYIYLF